MFFSGLLCDHHVIKILGKEDMTFPVKDALPRRFHFASHLQRMAVVAEALFFFFRSSFGSEMYMSKLTHPATCRS